MTLPRVRALLDAVRRRLRVAWAVEVAQLAAPVVAGAALLLVLIGRLVERAGYADPAASAVALVAIGSIVVVALTVRVPDEVAARAADRGLATHDAFAAVLELGTDDSSFAPAIRERADHLAAAASAGTAVPLRFHRRPVVLAGILGPVALVLGVVANPQDDARARRAAERTAIGVTADELEAVADDLAAEGETAAEATERLRQLAEQLRATADLESAAAELEQAASELTASIPPGHLSTKAATQGLERSLGQQPLGPDLGSGVEQQLTETAAGLGAATAEELEALADRLDDLADTQAAGDPATAAALDAAAAAARVGDRAAAAAELGEAAAAHAAASASSSTAEAARRAGAAARSAADRLGQRTGQGSDPGQGRGRGAGQGQGQGSGSGQGQGSGAGQGQGSGSGAGGSPSGAVTGGGGSGTPAPGRGGPGTGAGTAGGSAAEEPDTATIFDPAPFGEGESGTVGGGSDTGDGSTIGITDGPTTAGGRTVPLAAALPTYQAEATEAMDRAAVPPSVRDLVVAYFDALQGRNP